MYTKEPERKQVDKRIILYIALVGGVVQILLGFFGIGSLQSGGTGCLISLFVPTLIGVAAGYICGRNGQKSADAAGAGAIAAALSALLGGIINALMINFKLMSLSQFLELFETAIWIVLIFGLLIWVILSFGIGFVSAYVAGYLFYEEPQSPSAGDWRSGGTSKRPASKRSGESTFTKRKRDQKRSTRPPKRSPTTSRRKIR